MASVSVTNTFSANTTAQSSQVNTNFTDLVNYVNARNDSSATWDALYVTTADRVPMIVNNSTGSNDIVRFQDGGTNVLVIDNGGTTTITANSSGDAALISNNSTSTGDILRLQDNGTKVMAVQDGGKVSIGSADADGTLHVHTATAGTVVADTAADELVLENSAAGGLSILTPNNVGGNITFGDPEDNNNGIFQYDHNATAFKMTVGGNSRFEFDSGGNLHVDVSGSSDTQLEVSDGSSTGGGTIHRASSGTHSSENIKSHIRYMAPGIIQQAYNDVKILKPALFKYQVRDTKDGPLRINPSGRDRKGLILEDCPSSIKEGDTVVIDDRILNLEMAFQVLASKVEVLEGP